MKYPEVSTITFEEDNVIFADFLLPAAFSRRSGRRRASSKPFGENVRDAFVIGLWKGPNPVVTH